MEKAGYIIGTALGFLIIYGLYAISIYGVVTFALHGEMPYVPLIMLMSVYTARSVAQIKMLQAIRNEMEHIKNIAMIKQAKIDDDLKKVVNRVSRQGGLN